MIIADFYVNYFELLKNHKTENNILYSSSNLYEFNNHFFNEPKIIGKYFVKIIIFKNINEKVGKSTFIFDDNNISDIILPVYFSNSFLEKITYSNDFIYFTNKAPINKYFIKFTKNFIKGRYIISTQDQENQETQNLENKDIDDQNIDDNKNDDNENK